MDAPIHITYEDVVQAGADVIAEFGSDYVYRKPRHDIHDWTDSGSCRYVHTAQMRGDEDYDRLDPGCLAGTILNKLGVELTAMLELDTRGGGTTISGLLHELADDGVVTYTGSADLFLSNLQTTQDGGGTWGQAYSLALEGQYAPPQTK